MLYGNGEVVNSLGLVYRYYVYAAYFLSDVLLLYTDKLGDFTAGTFINLRRKANKINI